MFRNVFAPARLVGAVLVLVPAVAAAQNVERFELTGDRVGIFNLAGSAVVEAGSGSAVVVEVTRHGPDAAQLRIEQGRIGPGEALRVIYPDGDVVFSSGDWHGETRMRVANDGTFGGWAEGSSRRRVTIRSDGSGTEAHATLRILVPAGKDVDVYLGVGPMSATGVEADLRLDGSSGRVTTERTRGSLIVDTGSGSVSVTDHTGDALIDTGSGSVTASGVRDGDLRIDTGSGSVRLRDVTVRDLSVDTGSGRVEGSGIVAEEAMVDTGSGGVELAFGTPPRQLVVDTGSGGVTLTLPETLDATLHFETSSGGIEVDFPMQIRTWERDEVHGTVGNGRGEITVDTGSGDIIIRKG